MRSADSTRASISVCSSHADGHGIQSILHIHGSIRRGNCGNHRFRRNRTWLAPEKRRDFIRRPLVSCVCFVEQESRLASATWLNADQMDSDPELLRLLDADAKILIPGNEDRIADRSIRSECDHIGNLQFSVTPRGTEIQDTTEFRLLSPLSECTYAPAVRSRTARTKRQYWVQGCCLQLQER